MMQSVICLTGVPWGRVGKPRALCHGCEALIEQTFSIRNQLLSPKEQTKLGKETEKEDYEVCWAVRSALCRYRSQRAKQGKRGSQIQSLWQMCLSLRLLQ